MKERAQVTVMVTLLWGGLFASAIDKQRYTLVSNAFISLDAAAIDWLRMNLADARPPSEIGEQLYEVGLVDRDSLGFTEIKDDLKQFVARKITSIDARRRRAGPYAKKAWAKMETQLVPIGLGLILIGVATVGYGFYRLPKARETIALDPSHSASTDTSVTVQTDQGPQTGPPSLAEIPLNPPKQFPRAALNPSDVATLLDLWASLETQYLSEMVLALNEGYEVSESWPKRATSDRVSLLNEVEIFKGRYKHAAQRIDNLRAAYRMYPEVFNTLDQERRATMSKAIDDFYDALQTLGDPNPRNLEARLRPFSTSLKRELDAAAAWIGKTRSASQKRRRELQSLAK